MNVDEAKAYLNGEGRINGGKASFEVLRNILAKLGNPDKGHKKIHIAGTNGKGSVAAYSAYILASAGYRVAQYSSPAVYRFGERIRILDGRDNKKNWAKDPSVGEISDEDLSKYLNRIKNVVENIEIPDRLQPNYFDLLLLVAFQYFADYDCDVWVIEVGIGARLDATNVIDSPEVAVVTAIGMDHTEKLGDTLEKIAIEKSYILKEGCRALIIYDQKQAISDENEALCVMSIFEEKAKSLGIVVKALNADSVKVISRSLEGQEFTFKDMDLDLNIKLKTKLLPDVEPLNAALAISACKTIDENLSDQAIEYGVSACYWPARLEKIADNPIILIDGAHNPQGARVLRSSLDKLLREGDEEIHIYSSMQNKDQYNCIREIFKSEKIKALICTGIEGSRRAMDNTELFKLAKKIAVESFPDEENRPVIYNRGNVDSAVRLAFALYELDFEERSKTNNKVAIVNWGSFYTAGSFRRACEIELNKIQDENFDKIDLK